MVRRNRTKERARAGTVLDATTAPAPTADTPVAPPRDPPTGARWVTGVDGARALAERLLTPGRAWPVVAISVAAGHAAPYVDLDELVDEVSGLAEVVVLPTGDESWAFSAVMPPATQVYGGAARVYPVDHEWVTAPRRSRLRFAYSESDAKRLLDHLVHDCLTAALGAGLLGAHGDPDAPRVEGTVRSILGPRAFVALDDDSLASIAEELTVPGVSLARLLVVGQRVTGALDREGRRLDVRESLLVPDGATPPGADATLGGYVVGQVVLADVTAVSATTVRLRLVPGLTVDVPRDAVTGNPADALTDLFTVGEVVLARVVSTAPWALRLDDIDDDSTEAPAAAPSLLAGGPPWLVLPSVGHVAPARTLPELPPLHLPDVTALLGAPLAGPPGEPGAADGAPAGDGGPAVDLGPAADGGPAGDGADDPSPSATTGPDDGDHPGPDEAPGGALRRRTPLDLVTPADRPGPRTPPPTGRALRDMSLALEASRAQARGLDTALAAAQAEVLALRTTLQATTVELAGLRRRAAELEHEAAAAQSRATNFQTKYRRADLSRQQLKKDQRSTPHTDGPTDGGAFLDPVEQFRHEVRTAWIRRVPAAEKASKPLAAYTLGDRFLASLDATEGVSRAKVVDVVVEVLTGDAERIAGRELHPLRVNEGGGSPALVREDGATCWRASLQTRSASARRLHYWKRGDRIELSRVVLHDDMEP